MKSMRPPLRKEEVQRISAERELRRQSVAALYPQLRSITKVAAEIGCSTTTVWDDLKALGIPRMTPAESLALADAEINRRVTARRERVAELYREHRSTYKVAEILGCARTTICNDLTALGQAPGPRTKQKGEIVSCPNCNREHWRYDSQLSDGGHGDFCSRECWGEHRWKHGIAISPNLRSLASGRARQKHYGRWNAHKGGSAGVEGGRQGGRPPAMTADEAKTVWRLRTEGLTLRQIALEVFGDERFKDRVRRAVRA